MCGDYRVASVPDPLELTLPSTQHGSGGHSISSPARSVARSAEAHDARAWVDLDHRAIGDPGRCLARSDHGGQAELAGDDRGVAKRATLLDDERAENREDRVARRAGERGDQHVTRFEPLEWLEWLEWLDTVAHDAGSAAVWRITDAESVQDLVRVRGRIGAQVRHHGGGGAGHGGRKRCKRWRGLGVAEHARRRSRFDSVALYSAHGEIVGAGTHPRTSRSANSPGANSTTCSGVRRRSSAARRRPHSATLAELPALQLAALLAAMDHEAADTLQPGHIAGNAEGSPRGI